MNKAIYFRNSYGPRIWVAIAFWSSSCADYGTFATRGWWAIDHGGQAHVLNLAWQGLVSPFILFYAEAADGAVWTGSSLQMYVTQAAFDSCINIGSTNARLVGTRSVVMPNNPDSYTVNLIA